MPNLSRLLASEKNACHHYIQQESSWSSQLCSLSAVQLLQLHRGSDNRSEVIPSMRDFLKGMLASVTTNKVLTTSQVWVINFISLFTEFVVCFSYFSLCTVKEVLFYLYSLLPVQFQQQLHFNTFITSFFLTGKQTKGHTPPGFSLLSGTEIFYSSAPCPFQVLQLKTNFSQQHLFVTSSAICFLSQRFREPPWPNPLSTAIKLATQLAGGDHILITTGTPVPRRWVNQVLQYNALAMGTVAEVVWASIRTWLKGLGSRFTPHLVTPTRGTTTSGRAATATPVSAQNHKLVVQNKAARRQCLCIGSIPLAVNQLGVSPTGRENSKRLESGLPSVRQPISLAFSSIPQGCFHSLMRIWDIVM